MKHTRSFVVLLSLPEVRESIKIASTPSFRSIGFDLTIDGKCLYVLQDNTLTSFDTETGNEIAHVSSPIANSIGVLISNDQTYAYICSESLIAKVGLPEGNIVSQIDLPKPLVNWVRAVDNDSLGIVTNDKQLICIDGSLERIRMASNVRVANTRLSIHPKAERILATTIDGPLRWNLNTSGREIEPIAVIALDASRAIPVCGNKVDVWSDDRYLYQFKGSKLTQLGQMRGNIPCVALNGCVDLFECYRGDNETWVGLAYLLAGDRPWDMIIGEFDLNQDYWSRSYPNPIGKRPTYKQAKADRSGTVIAVQEEKSLTVFKRNRVDVSMNEIFSPLVRKLIDAHDFDSLRRSVLNYVAMNGPIDAPPGN